MHILINAIFYSLLTRKIKTNFKGVLRQLYFLGPRNRSRSNLSTATPFLGDPRIVVLCRLAEKPLFAEVLEQKRQEEDDWKRQLKEPFPSCLG